MFWFIDLFSKVAYNEVKQGPLMHLSIYFKVSFFKQLVTNVGHLVRFNLKNTIKESRFNRI